MRKTAQHLDHFASAFSAGNDDHDIDGRVFRKMVL